MMFAAPRVRVRVALAAVIFAALAGCTDRQLEPTGLPRALVPSRTVTGTTVTVTNTADAGAGSLRDAISTAPAGATIVFDPSIDGQTITLTSGQLMVTQSLTIQGSATRGITISGGGHSRVFEISALLPDAVVTLRNLTVTGGKSDVQAGGIENHHAILVLEYVLIAGNSGLLDGGGIFSDGPLTARNSTIAGNSANDGGGISIFSTFSLTNVTVVGNTAVSIGGGFIADDDVPTDTHEIHNSIIAGNSAPTAANCAYETQVTFSGLSISDDATCASPNVVMANPMLGALADNGGPSKTMAVLRGSPAIDAAPDCAVNDDQRHVARPLGAACDIGAYEFDNYIKTQLGIDASVVINPNTGVAVVTGTFGCAEPASVLLHVTLSEPQKGRVPAVLAAADSLPLTCASGSKAWSIALTPVTGSFSNGSGSVVANTDHVSPYVLAQSTIASVKLYWGHK